MPSPRHTTEPLPNRHRSLQHAGLAAGLATALALGFWLAGCTQSTPPRTIVVQGATAPTPAESAATPAEIGSDGPVEAVSVAAASGSDDGSADAPAEAPPAGEDAAVEGDETRQFSLSRDSMILGTVAPPPAGDTAAEAAPGDVLVIPPGMFDPPPDAEAQPVDSARRVLEGRRPGEGSGAADRNGNAAAEPAAGSQPAAAGVTQEEPSPSSGAATALSMLAAFSPNRTEEEPQSPVLVPFDAPPDLALSIDEPALPPSPSPPAPPAALQGPLGEVGPRPETGPAPQPIRHDDNVIRQGPWSVVCYQDNAVVFEHDRIYRVWRAEEQPPQWAYETIDGIRFRGRMGTDLNCTFRRS